MEVSIEYMIKNPHYFTIGDIKRVSDQSNNHTEVKDRMPNKLNKHKRLSDR